MLLEMATQESHPAPTGNLLKAYSIAAIYRADVEQSINAFSSSTVNRKPKLAGILATSSAPSKFYAEFTKKQCDELGVEFVLRKSGAAADLSLDEGEGGEDEGGQVIVPASLAPGRVSEEIITSSKGGKENIRQGPPPQQQQQNVNQRGHKHVGSKGQGVRIDTGKR